MFVGQESNSGLARWFWLSVISHKVAVKVSVGSGALVSWSCLTCLTERILKFSGILQKKSERKKGKSLSHFRLCNSMDTRLLGPWDFLGKSIGVGCHFLLQKIFPTQGSNPGLPHCRQMLYHLHHHGSPKSKSRVQLFATLWAIRSMEFPRPEYWSG